VAVAVAVQQQAQLLHKQAVLVVHAQVVLSLHLIL
jgi:hypothetical protein